LRSVAGFSPAFDRSFDPNQDIYKIYLSSSSVAEELAVETIAAGPSQRLFSMDGRVEFGNDERRNAIQVERHMV
jgi:hypothetical protein